MSDRNPTLARQTTRVIAASGRLRNEHFLLTADHILMEVDPSNFELVSAMAEGNIQVHMATAEPDGEYVIFAQSAVYRPHSMRLDINGWIGTRENGVETGPTCEVREIELPTDATYLLPLMDEQAVKRLPIEHRSLVVAA